MTRTDELLQQQWEMEYGPERVKVAEEAVRQADLSGDEQAGYEARMALIESAELAGQSEKLFPAFAWCQDYAGRHPDDVHHAMLAWYHKWLLSAAQDLPQIPLPRIMELHGSYAACARRLAAGASSVPYFKMLLALHLGDRGMAQREYTVWQFAKRDFLSDCPACEAQSEVEYHLFLGDDEAALQRGQRILDKPLTCSHIPHRTYGSLLRPLLRRGQREQAQAYAAKGRDLVDGNPGLLVTKAEHLEYLALTDPALALTWYARHLALAEQTKVMGAKQAFHAAAALLFTVLRGETLTRSPGGPGVQMKEADDVPERLAYHEGEARRIAALFDARNGNSYHTVRVDEVLSLAGTLGQ